MNHLKFEVRQNPLRTSWQVISCPVIGGFGSCLSGFWLFFWALGWVLKGEAEAPCMPGCADDVPGGPGLGTGDSGLRA